jgi:hypothetical protein
LKAEEARRLTQLKKENARLIKVLAEAELEEAMVKDLADRSLVGRNAAAGPSRNCRNVSGSESFGCQVEGLTAAQRVMVARLSTLRR